MRGTLIVTGRVVGVGDVVAIGVAGRVGAGVNVSTDVGDADISGVLLASSRSALVRSEARPATALEMSDALSLGASSLWISGSLMSAANSAEIGERLPASAC